MTDYKNLKVYKKSQINGLTKHLSGLRFVGRWDEPRCKRNELMIDRCLELGMIVDYNDSHLPGEKFTFKSPRKITGEQSRFGKAWLKNYFFKSDGKPRSGKRTEYVGQRVLDIAKSVTRFEFIGVLGCANSYWEINQFIPIYRAYNSRGQYFDYAPIHWGEPVVMEGC
jgi:hypothetical protein